MVNPIGLASVPTSKILTQYAPASTGKENCGADPAVAVTELLSRHPVPFPFRMPTPKPTTVEG
jgi:hypothetical protein